MLQLFTQYIILGLLPVLLVHKIFMVIAVLDVLGVNLLLELFLVLLSDFLALQFVLEFVAHLILDGQIIILPIELHLAPHVVQCQVESQLRRPMYIFLRCTKLPFLSIYSIHNFIYYPQQPNPNQNIQHPSTQIIITTHTLYIYYIADIFFHSFSMGCQSSNTVAPQHKEYPTSPRKSQHRNTPLQILTQHSIQETLKQIASPTARNKEVVSTQTPSNNAILTKQQQKMSGIESKKSIVEQSLPQKQNTSPRIFNTIPDCSPEKAKNPTGRVRGKKIKKHTQHPMQKQLKRLYGV